MKKPPAFQLYVKDWRSSTSIRSMRLSQKGVAIESLACSWDQDEPGTLPLPEEKAAKACGIPLEIFKNFRRNFPKFWQIDGDKLVNPKLRSQWEELQQVRRSQSDAARRTNEKLGRKPSLSDTLSESVTEPLTDPSAFASASATANSKDKNLQPPSPKPACGNLETKNNAETVAQLASAKSLTQVGKTAKELDARRRFLLDQAETVQKKFQSAG